MVICEKIYLEAYINNQYISFKSDTAQLYFILGRANFQFIFGYFWYSQISNSAHG